MLSKRSLLFLAGLVIVSLAVMCGCESPTAPPHGDTWVAAGSGFHCSSVPVVRPTADGSGSCAWCGAEPMVCAQGTFKVLPWDGTDEGWPE